MVKERRRHATVEEKRAVLAWQQTNKCSIKETVKHFKTVWNDKVAVSNRSFRRWSAKLYAYGFLHDEQSTDATALTVYESNDTDGAAVLYEFKELQHEKKSIFEEDEEDFAAPRRRKRASTHAHNHRSPDPLANYRYRGRSYGGHRFRKTFNLNSGPQQLLIPKTVYEAPAALI